MCIRDRVSTQSTWGNTLRIKRKSNPYKSSTQMENSSGNAGEGADDQKKLAATGNNPQTANADSAEPNADELPDLNDPDVQKATKFIQSRVKFNKTAKKQSWIERDVRIARTLRVFEHLKWNTPMYCRITYMIPLKIRLRSLFSSLRSFFPMIDAFLSVLLLSLIHISEPTRLGMISYAVFCLKKKKQ
eukprot:TRINITY_DN543_c0_g1_i9.p2 TRINITY_DN543_c0_g1~~TRINITY_DN543_c0_g1_i9.p2  ORF type:complete len:188 (-),score=37.48 TRINITY_DN543_c0_g1_i9:33-596(-)